MRKVTVEEIENLPVLPLQLPRGGQPSFPFSFASHYLYAPDELLCEDGDSTKRTDVFRRTLAALYWRLGNTAVPYVFREKKGDVRSMDAGCLGMLKRSRSVSFELNSEGLIIAVEPTFAAVEALMPLRERLLTGLESG